MTKIFLEEEVAEALVNAEAVVSVENVDVMKENEELVVAFVRNLVREGYGNMSLNQVLKALHAKVID